MAYLHINVKGYLKGYYEEVRAWDIVLSVPQEDVRFFAGPFDAQAVKELRNQTKQLGRRPLPIYES